MNIALKIMIALGTIYFAWLCVWMYWAWRPYRTLEFEHIELHTKEVVAGGYLSYSVDYCKYTDKAGYLDKRLIDGVIFHLPQKILTQPKGCRTDENIQVEVPEFFKGWYVLEVIVTYQVNPIRQESVKFTTERFYVTPK